MNTMGKRFPLNLPPAFLLSFKVRDPTVRRGHDTIQHIQHLETCNLLFVKFFFFKTERTFTSCKKDQNREIDVLPK